MADCHGGVLFQEQQRKGLADKVAAVDHDCVHAGNVNVVIVEHLHDAGGSARL